MVSAEGGAHCRGRQSCRPQTSVPFLQFLFPSGATCLPLFLQFLFLRGVMCSPPFLQFLFLSGTTCSPLLLQFPHRAVLMAAPPLRPPRHLQFQLLGSSTSRTTPVPLLFPLLCGAASKTTLSSTSSCRGAGPGSGGVIFASASSAPTVWQGNIEDGAEDNMDGVGPQAGPCQGHHRCHLSNPFSPLCLSLLSLSPLSAPLQLLSPGGATMKTLPLLHFLFPRRVVPGPTALSPLLLLLLHALVLGALSRLLLYLQGSPSSIAGLHVSCGSSTWVTHPRLSGIPACHF